MSEIKAVNKYSKGKIYKISSPHTDKIYVGSTVRSLNKRLSDHADKYKLYLKGKHHNVTSFKILETGVYKIELIEDYSCSSIEELRKRERYYIENNNCINRCIPGRTRKEYREDNRESIKQWLAKYRNDDENKGKAEKYMKKYYQENRGRIGEQTAKYRLKNKERTANLNGKSILCNCGRNYTHGNRARHMRSNNHLHMYSVHMKQSDEIGNIHNKVKEIVEMKNTDQIYKRTQEQFSKIMKINL